MIGQSAQGSVPDVAASRKGAYDRTQQKQRRKRQRRRTGRVRRLAFHLAGPCLRSRDRIPHAPRYRERGGTVSGDSRRL